MSATGDEVTKSGAATTEAVPSASTGRGRGRGRHSGRGQRSGDRTTGGRGPPGNQPKGSVFKGNTADMNGNVFQCFNENENKNQFNKTVEALGEYIAKNMKHAGDMMPLTKRLVLPAIAMPEDLDLNETSRLKIALWDSKVKAYQTKVDQLESNLKATYAVIWGQCSEAMKAKLKSLPDFSARDAASDCIWILKEIKGIMLRFEGQRYIFLSLYDAHHAYYHYRQGPDTSLSKYLEDFQGLIDVLEHYGGSIGHDDGLVSTISGGSTGQNLKASRNKAVALAFLRQADRKRYGALWADLENQFSRGNDQYPIDLTAAYSMLINYKPAPTQHKERANGPNTTPTPKNDETTTPEETGLTFAQTTAAIPGSDGLTHAHITCFECQSNGHYASTCPKRAGFQLLQQVQQEPPSGADSFADEPGFSFMQSVKTFDTIPKSWVLLDSQSTASVFNNPRYLTNIRRSAHALKIITNGGLQHSYFVGEVRNFGTVWYNPQSIANILSLAAVRKVCRITMDTAVEAALCVHRTDGTVMKFIEYSTGLYYFDTSQQKLTTSQNITGYSFVTTVAGNQSRFHRREIAAADAARKLYRHLGRPSQAHFEHILANNLLLNCPVTVDDARRAIAIYGPDPGSLMGKTTKRPAAEHVPTFHPIPAPAFILADHRKVTLCVDIFYVQGHRFLHTVSRKLQFRTVTHVSDVKKDTLYKQLQLAINLYHSRGFQIVEILADMAFECLEHEFMPIRFDFTAHDSHVGEVERSIRTIKERVRADLHGLPFKRLPKIMIVELVRRAVKCLNQFPALDGVSTTVSPLTIMTGVSAPDYNQLQLEFGSYAMVFEDNDPTNTTKSRTTGAIVLTPTGNRQGDYYFMSLITGRRLARHQWTELPMPNGVIHAVEARAFDEKQPLIAGGCPIFEWRQEQIADDDDEYNNGDGENEVFVDDQDFPEEEHAGAQQPAPEVHFDIEDDDEVAEDASVIDNEVDNYSADENNIEEDEGASTSSHDDEEDEGAEDADGPDAHYNDEDTGPEGDGANDGDATMLDQGAGEPRYNLRGTRERTYTHRFDHQMDVSGGMTSYEPQYCYTRRRQSVTHPLTCTSTCTVL